MRHERASPEAGFSLVELLIALALLAAIGGLLVASIGDARRGLGAVDRRNAHAAVAPVQAVLRRLIEQARPAPDGSIDAKRRFVGEPDRLSFVSSFVPQGQYGGLRRYDIGLDGGSSGSAQLVMRHRLALDAATPTTVPDASAVVLLEGIASFRVRYFGVGEEGAGPAWHERWDHRAALPLLVSVEVAFVRGDGRQWTRLAVGLPLAR